MIISRSNTTISNTTYFEIFHPIFSSQSHRFRFIDIVRIIIAHKVDLYKYTVPNTLLPNSTFYWISHFSFSCNHCSIFSNVYLLDARINETMYYQRCKQWKLLLNSTWTNSLDFWTNLVFPSRRFCRECCRPLDLLIWGSIHHCFHFRWFFQNFWWLGLRNWFYLHLCHLGLWIGYTNDHDFEFEMIVFSVYLHYD